MITVTECLVREGVFWYPRSLHPIRTLNSRKRRSCLLRHVCCCQLITALCWCGDVERREVIANSSQTEAAPLSPHGAFFMSESFAWGQRFKESVSRWAGSEMMILPAGCLALLESCWSVICSQLPFRRRERCDAASEFPVGLLLCDGGCEDELTDSSSELDQDCLWHVCPVLDPWRWCCQET